MPGPKTNNKPSIFERLNIFKKIKEALEKGWDALRTATTAVAVRVLGGKEEFSKYMERHDSFADALETLEAKNYAVGDKVAVKSGSFNIEGTVLQKSENEQGAFVTVELCDGKVQTFPAEAVETIAAFEERNAELPKEYRQILIDAESYSKYADIIKREQELKEQQNKDNTPDKQEEQKAPDKQKEQKTPKEQEEQKSPEEQEKIDVPEVGEKFIFLTTLDNLSELDDIVLSGTEMTVTGMSEDGKSVLMQEPDGKISEVSLQSFQDWRAMPKEKFETAYKDNDFIVVKSPENQQGEMANVYIRKQIEKQNVEKEAASDVEFEEMPDELFDVSQEQGQEVSESEVSDSTVEQEVQTAEESRFDISEDLQSEVDEVKEDVEWFSFDDDEQKIADYEASAAYDREHQPVSLAENRDSLSVGMHFAYSFKGKYQEATVTAINKKSIDIQTNDGREFQIKNADKEKAIFGYEEIKADKDVANRVMDQNSTKFSDMFRTAYEKTDDRHALEAEAEELGIDLYADEYYADELDDIDTDFDNIDVDEGPTSLSDQVREAREEANSRSGVNRNEPSHDDGPSLDD